MSPTHCYPLAVYDPCLASFPPHLRSPGGMALPPGDIGINLARAEAAQKCRDNGMAHDASQHVGMLVARMLVQSGKLLWGHLLGIDLGERLLVGASRLFEAARKLFRQLARCCGFSLAYTASGFWVECCSPLDMWLIPPLPLAFY